MEGSALQDQPHSKVREVVAKYPPVSDAVGWRYAIYEYQKPFEWFEVWEYKNPDTKKMSFFETARAKTVAFAAALTRVCYRTYTAPAKFKHCRLVILQKDGSDERFKGKVWSFTDGEGKAGAFKEEGIDWQYDDTSYFEAGTATVLNDAEIQRRAIAVKGNEPYHAIRNNCEIFCRCLTISIRDQRYEELLSVLRTRSRPGKHTNLTQEFLEKLNRGEQENSLSKALIDWLTKPQPYLE